MTTTEATTDDTTTAEPELEHAAADVDTTGASVVDEAAVSQADVSVDEDQDDDEPDEDQDDGPDGAGREAAKYRRRLREAEAERDQLAERVESLQRAEVERAATADGLRPAALWASGVELANLLADDGTVDGPKVLAAIEASREELGIPAPPVGPRVPREGRSPGRPPKPSGKDAMVSVVMGRED